jgi:hypothetical protein
MLGALPQDRNRVAPIPAAVYSSPTADDSSGWTARV